MMASRKMQTTNALTAKLDGLRMDRERVRSVIHSVTIVIRQVTVKPVQEMPQNKQTTSVRAILSMRNPKFPPTHLTAQDVNLGVNPAPTQSVSLVWMEQRQMAPNVSVKRTTRKRLQELRSWLVNLSAQKTALTATPLASVQTAQ
jgi:hypothetical protein